MRPGRSEVEHKTRLKTFGPAHTSTWEACHGESAWEIRYAIMDPITLLTWDVLERPFSNEMHHEILHLLSS
jgi:hypothetical protein